MDFMRSVPIEPGIGIGVFKLKEHIREYFDIIMQYNYQKYNPLVESYSNHGYLNSPFEVVYKFGTYFRSKFPQH